jgi:hypothetical protein
MTTRLGEQCLNFEHRFVLLRHDPGLTSAGTYGRIRYIVAVRILSKYDAVVAANISRIGMVIGQSLDLWSRLHLVTHRKRHLRAIFMIIIFDSVLEILMLTLSLKVSAFESELSHCIKGSAKTEQCNNSL